jgi:AcrR family transcriptional regulator
MGLTQGAIFRHFPSKDSIVQAVIEWVTERLMSRVDKAAQSQASPLQALEAVFVAHIGFIAEHPGAPRMLLAELQKAGDSVPKRMVTALIGGYRERLAWLLERGKEAGEVDPQLDVESATTLYVGMIQGLVMQSLSAGEPKRLLRDAPKAFAIFRKGIARSA